MSRSAVAGASAPRPKPVAGLADYVAIARPDHWLKHVFIVPGVVLAYALAPTHDTLSLWAVGVGFLAAAFAASANYVINEWLDAGFDAHHPTKSARPAVAKAMAPGLVYGEYALLALLALAAALSVSTTFLLVTAALLVSGLTYNVRPFRSKDKAYLDVLSEAVNNPIRLMLGWAMVDSLTLPPSSLLLAYWMGGAFLMATKRFAEYRSITASHGAGVLHLYRASFRRYTEERLLLLAFTCALLAAFFIAVFLIKYRVEYLLALPLFALLFAMYLRLGLKEASNAQTPEKLFREHGLLATVAALVVALAFLTFVDLPRLAELADPHYIAVPWSPR